MLQNNTIPQFKAWDNDRKEWLDNKELLIDMNGICWAGTYLDTNKDSVSYEVCRQTNTIICRFTGLFDKNNVPIYERDLFMLKSGGYRVVCFINYSHTSYHGAMNLGTTHVAGFYNRDYYPVNDQRPDMFYGFAGDIEIVGNTLENPNLLEAQNE